MWLAGAKPRAVDIKAAADMRLSQVKSVEGAKTAE
jgi:hypothetical protein